MYISALPITPRLFKAFMKRNVLPRYVDQLKSHSNFFDRIIVTVVLAKNSILYDSKITQPQTSFCIQLYLFIKT